MKAEMYKNNIQREYYYILVSVQMNHIKAPAFNTLIFLLSPASNTLFENRYVRVSLDRRS